MKPGRIFYLQSSNTFDFPIKCFCLVRRIQKELELIELHQRLVFPEDVDVMCAGTNITKANNGSVLAATGETAPVGMTFLLCIARCRVTHMG